MYFSLTQIAGMIATRADAMIIKLFLPLQSVGIYSLGMRLSEYAGMFCSHLTRALSPVFAELHGAADESNIRAANLMGTKLSVAFATPLLLGLGLLAQPLILAWTGPDFIMAVPVCQWLAASVMVGIIHGNTVSMLSMGGRQRFVAFAIIVGQILNLILSFVLVRSMGIVGVAMATFITTAPIYVFVIQGFALDYRVKSVLKFYGSTVIPALIPAMIMAIGFLGFLKYRPPQNLLEVAILQGLGVGLFGIVYWYIGFNSKERTYFSQKLFKNVFRRNNQG
jgi:O-antigen/teichoic acid export membrane protein